MASLELIPHLPVLAVQTGVFLAGAVVVDSLFVKPYLAVRQRRDQMTTGSQADAAKFASESEAIAARVSERLISAAAVAKNERDAIRAAAMERRGKLVGAAETVSKGHVEAISQTIRTDLAAERQKVPQIVRQLAEDVYQAAMT